MPAVDLVERKRRRRLAARTLLSRKREAGRHLVDGVHVDSLPFDAGEAWAAHQEQVRAESEALRAAVEAGEFEEDVCLAEPVEKLSC